MQNQIAKISRREFRKLHNNGVSVDIERKTINLYYKKLRLKAIWSNDLSMDLCDCHVGELLSVEETIKRISNLMNKYLY